LTKIKSTHLDEDGRIVEQEHDIEGSPTNLKVVLHQQGIKVDVPSFVEINPTTTLKCMDEMTENAWLWISQGGVFQALWKEAHDPSHTPTIPKSIKHFELVDLGVKHMAGMIVMAYEAAVINKQNVFIRNPETYLHPATERYVVSMFEKIIQLSGCVGEVKTTTDTEVKAYDAQGREVPKPTGPPSETDKQECIRWLELLENADIAKDGDKVLTANDCLKEVLDDTSKGWQIVGLYVAKRDGR